MKKVLIVFLFCFPALVLFSQNDLINDVNPLIGTQGLFLYGRTTPFVTPPFGMTHWTACTRNSGIAIPNYQYLDHTMRGFRASHKPAMWMGDYGYVTLKPVSGNIDTKLLDRKTRFSHRSEIAAPDYYAVTVKPDKIRVEMTATERCGIMRYTFLINDIPSVLIEASQLPDFNGWIKIDTAKREIIGWNSDRHSSRLGPPLPNFKGYFVLEFDKPFTSFGTWKGDTLQPDKTEQMSNACGAWVSFVEGTQAVEVKIGTSFISIEQARENLKREVADKTFKQVRNETAEQWNNYLGRIEIEGASQRDRKIFYSAMYHTLLFPRQFSEYGRYYSAFDDTIHNGIAYNDYSLWDTYRAQHPLLILTAPEHVPGMVQSLIDMYEQGGYMPKWPNPTYTGIMIGTHADAVLADAVVKGVKGFSLQKAYEACMKDAMVPSGNDSVNRWADRASFTFIESRAGLHWYKKLGYIPVDKTNESVSNTLEGAYDDFCVAQVAQAAGHNDDYNMLMQRNKNYVNVYNPATQMMAPRNSNGSWHTDTHAGFTEGSPWTYLFAVQHDIPGLISLMGRETFIKKLNANFKGFRYIHPNEPGHHYTYLYNYVGQAWKTQRKVKKARALNYSNNPHGIWGDDDCGQMSAWYIFSSLGFYPVTPGTDVYAIGTPKFPKATLHIGDKKFEIIANNVSRSNFYVQSVTLNGVKLAEPFLHHADIVNGGTLVFEMGPRPNKVW